jgi:parallel beta-helix repeat protein
MATSRRSLVSLGVFALLAVLAGLGYWYQSRQIAPGRPDDSAIINVTNGDDRGPGSLREAMFIAAAAENEATISVNVPKITLATSLPPLVGQRGVRLIAADGPAEIDASALSNGPVLDITGANATVEGLRIRHCKASGILLRAEHFKLLSTTIESCDVGIDVAANASHVLIERSRFVSNRVGLRFAASNHNTMVVKNEFAANRDAGIWAVRSEPDLRAGAINIRENRFTKERIGVLTANVAVLLERNELLGAREAAMQLMGAGAVARGNRISGGEAMGIVVENGRNVVVEENEIDGLTAYGVMVKASEDTLLRANRVHNSGYGLAFVLGNSRSPSTAIGNTILEPKFHGIDVIGDSPVLRNNHVVRPRALALKVVDFQPEHGDTVRSQPLLEGNNFDAKGALIAGRAGAASGGAR